MEGEEIGLVLLSVMRVACHILLQQFYCAIGQSGGGSKWANPIHEQVDLNC